MYRLINIKYLIILSLFFQCSSSQEKESVVYLIFEEGKSTNCVKTKSNSSKKKDISKVEYSGYMNRSKDKLSFLICNEIFRIKKESKVEEIKLHNIKKFNIADFNFFIKKRFETNMFSKSNVFDKIYFLEKISDDKYLKYYVFWVHNVHNKGI